MPQLTVISDSRLFSEVFRYGSVCFEDLTYLIRLDHSGGVILYDLPEFLLCKHKWVAEEMMGIAPHPFLVKWTSHYPVEPSESHLPPNIRLITNRNRYEAWVPARARFLDSVQATYDSVAWSINLQTPKQFNFNWNVYYVGRQRGDMAAFGPADEIQPERITDVHICDFSCPCDDLEPLA